MQIFTHKNKNLTICQRFFIEKSLELLSLNTIDSYRVKLNNPKTILEELKYCLQEFEKGRIKHFQTIKGKGGQNAIVEEAISLLSWSPNYLNLISISQKYLEDTLRKIDENNYKRVLSSIDLLLAENQNYLQGVVNGLENLIEGNQNLHQLNDTTFAELSKINITLNILFSELIDRGFSKGFLYKLVCGIFVNSLGEQNSFQDHFKNFRLRILSDATDHVVIFRMDTTQKVCEAISELSSQLFELSDNINNIKLSDRQQIELKKFNISAEARKYIHFTMKATDYLSALKHARNSLSEYLDVINLGLPDEFLKIHNRVLVIDSRSPSKGEFQNNINILDGKYKGEKNYYLEFTKKLPSILNNKHITSETKEKIKSAIRYLRLGNQSTEVEHKFLNYWIGLEYLFSNYENQSTINRIKEHFINADALAYVKRNVLSFKKSLSSLNPEILESIPSCRLSSDDFLCEEVAYQDVGKLLDKYPLLAYRAISLKQSFFVPGKLANAADYLKRHKTNLEIHFTRIYRLRNEIIHDAATNTNNEQIASHLRYYLTFMLNELIDFLAGSVIEVSIEDYFILNEIRIGNIGMNGYLIKDLLSINCSIEFMK